MLYGTTLATPFGLRREIDKLFDDAMGSGGRGMSWAPVVDIQEDEKEIAIVAELVNRLPLPVDRQRSPYDRQYNTDRRR